MAPISRGGKREKLPSNNHAISDEKGAVVRGILLRGPPIRSARVEAEVKAAVLAGHAAIASRDMAKNAPLWVHDADGTLILSSNKTIAVGCDAVLCACGGDMACASGRSMSDATLKSGQHRSDPVAGTPSLFVKRKASDQ